MSVFNHFPIIKVICKYLLFQDFCNLLFISKKCAKFFKESAWFKETMDKIRLLRNKNWILKDIDQTELLCMETVKKYGLALKYVKNQTEEICFEAVKQNGAALCYVKDQTEEICLEAVKNYGNGLQFVRNQTERICVQAIKTHAWSLEFVKDQTESICIQAVKQEGKVLVCVRRQTQRICEEAIKQNINAVWDVNYELRHLFINKCW